MILSFSNYSHLITIIRLNNDNALNNDVVT